LKRRKFLTFNFIFFGYLTIICHLFAAIKHNERGNLTKVLKCNLSFSV
jgi:hypothetical protein